MKHPAKELGAWLKVSRQRQGFVARMFAGQIELSAAKYAELEAGVVSWLGEEQEQLIPQVLGLSKEEKTAFSGLLERARDAEPLNFSDIFSRERLEPVRLRHNKRKQLTAETKERILDAVFKPLR